jgi:hypothetical protein
MSQLAEDLKAAKALIADEAKWTRRTFEEGGCFCALGAVAEAVKFDPWSNWSHDPRAWNCKLALEAETPDRDVPAFNDHPRTTHADVLALFDRAIAAAEAQS